jgi:hypothetical protein
MVKNDGGNKGKGLARKHVNAAKCGGSKQLRVATQEAERYAVVSKMLGNGMCYVRLLSGGVGGNGDKLCIIRNKFKGRGKRDNILDSGSWVLVGMREWSSKQDTCDLLEVYNHGERDRLMKNEPCFKSVVPDENTADIASSVQFADSNTLKYSKLVKDNKDNDSDESDSDVLHQREYNMPSDDSDDSDNDSDDDSDDDSDNDSDKVVATVVATVAVKAAPKLKVDHINVDDI